MSTDCEPADLQRRLRNLQRKDREWEEEQGLNVLFLAVGFLNWVDEDGVEARSPLRETARQFGWRRTGQHIDRGLSEGIERLLKAGRLYLQANMLVVSDDLAGPS